MSLAACLLLVTFVEATEITTSFCTVNEMGENIIVLSDNLENKIKPQVTYQKGIYFI